LLPCLALRQLGETEKSLKKSLEEHKRFLKSAERRVKDLEGRLEQEGRDSSKTDLLKTHLAQELEADREQYQKDLAERDFNIDQTRKTYQGKFRFIDEVKNVC
jgi:myosin protein heavy chain